METLEKQIFIQKHIADKINAYLQEEREDYSSKELSTVFTACFDDGMEADIKMVWDGGFVDPVLFDPKGHEVQVLEPDADRIEGEYIFSYNEKDYKVEIVIRE